MTQEINFRPEGIFLISSLFLFTVIIRIFPLIFFHRTIMLKKGIGKLVGSIIFRDEIKTLGRRGMQDSCQGISARIADGTGRKTSQRIGIIGSRCLQIFSGNFSGKFFGAVNNGRIGLQPHAELQPVMKDTGNKGSLFRGTGLFFDD